MKEERITKVVDYVRFKNNHIPSEDDEVIYQHEIYEVTTIIKKGSIEIHRRRLNAEVNK